MYLDVTSLGMFLTYGSAEVGEIFVVSRCFASCRVVTTAATVVVVVYVTMQAMFGGVKPPC